MTFVPNSSMLLISDSCGSVPLLYFRSKRERPRSWTVRTIFAATVSGARHTGAVGSGFSLEVVAAARRPAALAADPIHHRRDSAARAPLCLIIRFRHVPGEWTPTAAVVFRLLQLSLIQIHERQEAPRAASDDRRASAEDVAPRERPIRASADADPRSQAAVLPLADTTMRGGLLEKLWRSSASFSSNSSLYWTGRSRIAETTR